MVDEEDWKVLSGCNACINSLLCNKMGNCILLSVDVRFPDNVKSKRRLISRMRHMTDANCTQFVEEIKESTKWISKEQKLKEWKSKYGEASEYMPQYRTWEGKVNLTKLEQMFIAELNKPR